jgi:uncharacterized protein YndB with AHSA1/START domain
MDDDRVFKALADPTRRLLLDRLFERDGRTLGELEAEVPELTRFGVMRHLEALEKAGLVLTRKVGRHKHHYLNPVPIRVIYERWMDKYRRPRVMALLDLRDRIEERTMTTATNATKVYQLYIKAPPERIWEAITDPELVARFFGVSQESTFEVGSPIRNWSPDRSQLWSDNVVLESDPPRKLVHTWRSLYHPAAAAEPESRVTWEIEPQEGGYSKLTFTHDQLENSPNTARVTAGWPYILSSLKTLLETGEPLPPRIRR